MSKNTTAANTQILSMYEILDMSPQEIATDLGYEEAAIKAVLHQFSDLYRERNKAGLEKEEDISEEEYKMILSAYKEIALYSDVDSVRERALRTLINEKKGRNDTQYHLSALQKSNINVTIFNQQLIAARQSIQKSLAGTESCLLAETCGDK